MIKIVTDTTASLPVAWTRERDIPVLPQIVIFGDTPYRDDTELDTEAFLAKLRASPTLPQTAAPPPALYTPIFQRLLDAGHAVLVIVPSGEVSGTLRSAETAAQDFPDGSITIFDTRSVAAPFAAMVMLAWEWAGQGLRLEEILARLEDLKRRQRIYFLVATLEYLRRGGRIGGAQALIGSVLQVKPILALRDGRVEPFEQQRTHRRALERLVELALKGCPPGDAGHPGVMHCGAEEEAAALAETLRQELGAQRVPVYLLPPAVVTHSGPGVLGVGFFAPG